ncbi:hypothetical protein [Streptomyces sp. NPDC005438]|uniref:hypothetical protein n=1 Tax=Streptomyces sp. NPDC005438 TaxID=3156880 RepID=UPI0033ABA185
MSGRNPEAAARSRAGRRQMLLAWSFLALLVVGALPYAWALGAPTLVLVLIAVWVLPAGWMAVDLFAVAWRGTPDPLPEKQLVTVVGHTRSALEHQAELVRVEWEVGGERLTSTLADLVHEDHLPRFRVGTQWWVHPFPDSQARVVLAADHDDVLRDGYDLSGVRAGAEGGGTPGYGSELRPPHPD